MDYLLNIYLALREFFWLQFLSLFVIILQLKKAYFHASHTGSVGIFAS